MKVGDKVRFLNTTGGGIVKGFEGKDTVLVEDESGFDIPMSIRECILIEASQEKQVKQSQDVAAKNILKAHAQATQVVEEEYKAEETKEGEQMTVCLAYLPIDSKNMSMTGFECYLVNDSNYYLSYSYMSQSDDKWIVRNAGIVEPNTKLFVEEFEKDKLNDIEHVCIQYLAYKKGKPFALKNVQSMSLHLDTVKFYKLHSFRDNDYFDEDALVYTLIRKDLPARELKISAEELELALKEKQSAQQRPRIQAIVKKEKSEILEIDLHIDELLDNTNGLSNSDMLEYQMSKFEETIEANKKNRGTKIVFIHGKGDGILKSEILKMLKTKYKSMYYQDASFREYGYGATMVTIK